MQRFVFLLSGGLSLVLVLEAIHLMLDMRGTTQTSHIGYLVRQNYISTFQKPLTWQDMTKNHETAWLYLKDTLLHIIWAEDTWNCFLRR